MDFCYIRCRLRAEGVILNIHEEKLPINLLSNGIFKYKTNISAVEYTIEY